MIVDAADQTIFQNTTDLDLTNYQSYDKALDIYYLAIAYLSTMRNWRSIYAFNASRFLWYYRLVGVVLFELTHTRSLLLIFPNTFEYFFDFVEGVKTRWNPLRMSKRTILAAAAFIWIFIKLPQEYWIHVAQLDTTDVIKGDLFGVPLDTPFTTIIKDNPLFFVGLGLILAGLIYGLRWYIKYELPPKDWDFTFDADKQPSESDVSTTQIEQQVRSMRGHIFTMELLEKTALIAMVTIIFTRIIPGTASEPWEQAVMVAVFMILTIGASELAVRIFGWGDQALAGSFVGTMAINSAVIFLLRALIPGDRSFHWAAALFFVLLISILITFYDRYRPIYLARFGDDRVEARLARQLGGS